LASAAEVQSALRQLATPQKAAASARFFKTGPGQYGEGDKFIGVTVPQLRRIARQFKSLDFENIEKLLASPIHEDRLTALIILVSQFRKASPAGQKVIFQFYLAHATQVNNWDLVDSSAAPIAGAYLMDKDRRTLERLAKSSNVWERRIAIVATYYFIKAGQPDWTFRIANQLLTDSHDLIQKAVGWMLREVGKQSGEGVLQDYLRDRYRQMPRTMLRYSIEHFPPETRLAYLMGTI
jgi:3-methyladenine DNA glycosylase AlkD